ncbi:hypothetical protein AGABI1DRAFT_111050 [Agaricus bisporus var. burnettii JB137-S8]|uniref:Phytocyanin domain-containing protein n=1 Tax=Agaricus bisporus var. burnettii (strain JB137-S8 / ATCC MYA-4627 / FGSC 10392) TaxID=597362 RepID=K5XG69_AGABU|nr:uncharacterized protein AGABI1DRAFT_111050 [Agaricus bisporus var. burnettii JB137-S8]EKM82423.1 hypothetical protein AGABI1DRAFT_111050 [Agaricus bisporus var. burnettii JB137-S8]
MSKNHTVTQSTFPDPCNPMAGGIDSGFQAVTPGSDTIPSWSITINDPSKPLWFYCKQSVPVSHCNMGMVFAINDSADKSFAAFQATAKGGAANSTTTTTPPATGGNPPAAGGAGSPSSGGAPTDSGAPADPTSAPNGAITSRGLNSAGAVSIVSLIAAVAGFML